MHSHPSCVDLFCSCHSFLPFTCVYDPNPVSVCVYVSNDVSCLLSSPLIFSVEEAVMRWKMISLEATFCALFAFLF